MGTWGAGIYQNDMALDLKDMYIKALKYGKTDDEAYDLIMNKFFDGTLYDDDYLDAMLAFANVLWDYGRLTEEVKNKALELLDSEKLLGPYVENENFSKKKAVVFKKLKEKLETPQPPIRRIRVERPYHCEWKIGDTFAYKFESNESKEFGLYGRSLILIKVAERIFTIHTVPIVMVKLTDDEDLPKTIDEINDLPFFLTDRVQEVMVSKKIIAKKKYKFSDGCYYTCYISLVGNISKSAIPKKLVYLGNFENIKYPDNLLPFSIREGETMEPWKYFEKRMLQDYGWYVMNLNESLKMIWH